MMGIPDREEPILSSALSTQHEQLWSDLKHTRSGVLYQERTRRTTRE